MGQKKQSKSPKHSGSRTLIVVKVSIERSYELQQFFQEITGFHKCYAVSRTNPSETLEVWFKRKLTDREDKLLRGGIERRNAKIIDDFPEKKIKNHETKIKLRNSLIYSVIAYLSGFGGISGVSTIINGDANFTTALIAPLVSAAAAFFTRLKLELKI